MADKAESFSYNKWMNTSMDGNGIGHAKLLNFLKEYENQIVRVLIIRNGETIFDYCPYPYKRELPFSVYSISKSVTGTAIGLAVDEGLVNENDLLLSFYPEYIPLNMNEFKKKIKIRDLLSMSCGHRYADNGYPGGDPEYDNYQQTSPEKTYIERFLDRPVLNKPGSHFVYNTDGIIILCDIIKKLTGKNVIDYLNEKLFSKIGIKNTYCDGNNGGYGFFFQAEDLAKYGLLYMNHGEWQKSRLISKDWAAKSSRQQVEDAQYGYCFQLPGDKGEYMASGLFGQYLCLYEQEETVCVINSIKCFPETDTAFHAIKECIADKGKNEKDFLQLKEYTEMLEKTPDRQTVILPEKAYEVSGLTYKVKMEFCFEWVFLPELFSEFILHFENDCCILKSGNYSFRAGLDGIFTENTVIFQGMPRIFALKGSWIENDKFIIDFRDLTSPAAFLLHFDYKDMILTVTDKINWGLVMGGNSGNEWKSSIVR